MVDKESFDAFLQDVIANETTPIDHEQHPGLEVFLDELAGELALDARSKFVAHLATCPSCLSRWRTLKKTLQEEQEVLEAKSWVPDLAEFIHQRQPATLITRMREWLDSLWSTPILKPALALATTSLAAIAITLAVTIPLLRNPTVATSEHLVALKSEVKTLQSQVRFFTQIEKSLPNNFVLAYEVTPEDLLQFDWASLRSYIIQPEDQWKSIAATELGNTKLWPLIWLLNVDKALPDKLPPTGETILLPTPLE